MSNPRLWFASATSIALSWTVSLGLSKLDEQMLAQWVALFPSHYGLERSVRQEASDWNDWGRDKIAEIKANWEKKGFCLDGLLAQPQNSLSVKNPIE